MSALSDLLNSGTVTAYQAAELAEKKGIHLPYGTLSGYWAGNHGRPTAKSLKALAQVVPFTEKQLQEAAWGKPAPLGPWIPTKESIHLDGATRKALDALIRSVVGSNGALNVVEGSSLSGASDETPEDEKTNVVELRPGEPDPQRQMPAGVGDELPGVASKGRPKNAAQRAVEEQDADAEAERDD